jgi:RNA 2',3'-cyclic 3'-phosphodiesterase
MGQTPTAADVWRLFVAIRVPRAIAEAIVSIATSVPAPTGIVRWVDPADLHATVWFIGDVAASDVAIVRDRLAGLAADTAAFDLEVAGAGTFGRGRGRASWVGLAAPGASRMAALAAELDGGPFHAHVTVGRGAPPDLAAALARQLAGGPHLAWRATAMDLLRSHPGRRPAYETIGRFPFSGGRATA